MDKILLFNGCSFTAGDGLAWDQFCQDFSWRDLVITRSAIKNNKISDKEAVALYVEYVKNFRPKKNLAALCSEVLETTKIDLSLDGNSNDNITLSTINYLMRLDPAMRKKIHICVGWTSIDRRIKFSQNKQAFRNLHSYSLLDENTEHHSYVTSAIIENTDVDHSLNYIMNVINLENYLLANNISYTFWRALANEPNHNCWEILSKCPTTIHDLMSNSSLPISSISNKKNWIEFKPKYDPWIGSSWDQTLIACDKISNVNQHPNLKSVINLAEIISKSINL